MPAEHELVERREKIKGVIRMATENLLEIPCTGASPALLVVFAAPPPPAPRLAGGCVRYRGFENAAPSPRSVPSRSTSNNRRYPAGLSLITIRDAVSGAAVRK
jgi:hypothetical protein